MKRTLTEVSKKYAGTYPAGTSKIEVGYVPYYEQHLPEKVDKFLEIGVWNGESMRMFREFYEGYGQFHVWDYLFGHASGTVSRTQLESEGFITHEGGQADIAFCNTIKDQFDVIVEDASHHSDEQVITFKHLFVNNVKPGGLYVLEDLHCCNEEYWWRGKMNSFEDTALAIFKKFISGGNLTSQYISEQENEQLIGMIDQIVIHGEGTGGVIAFIYKKNS